ncbi:hypothetical protein RQP46_005279 [Phenoliferia psychrophenolica]
MHPSTSHSRKTTDTSLPSSTPLSRVSAFRGRPGRVLGGLTILFLLALSSLSPKPKSTINSQLDIETFTFTNTTHPIPPTCETCIADPEDALCRRYGIENLISIGIIGASVTAGHGIEGHPKWFEVFLQDWMLSFPNTTVYDGSAPGMNSQFYSYCFESYVPPSADLYMIELDVNNDNAEYTFRHDDALYRGLLQLPHHPAVLRVSVPAMSFWELARGSPSGLLMSNYFDIPMIGIRNIIVPHLLLHPNDTPTFFHLDADGVETRHIPYISHQAQGDLLALYMREQVCKTKQRLGMRITPRESMWPSEDILREIPDQHLWESWEPGSHISPIHPSCSLRSYRGRKVLVASGAAALAGLAALLVTQNGLSNLRSAKHSSGPVDWQPCALNPAYSCGYLEVPKDYFNLTVGTAQIAMLKVPATARPSERLGTIFLNPGGPGGSGVGFALGFGTTLSKLLEGRYDLLGFDPRGIGASIPRVECFPSTLEHELFKAATVMERGFDVHKDAFSPAGRLHLLDHHRQLMSLQETQYKKCAETMGDDLKYMGTSTVVRDIEEMSRVLEGEDALINFFGGSYGTILGAYLVNMIPDKINRVLIDGVASSPQFAGPKACALATKTGEDPKDIMKRLEDYLDTLYDHPLAVPDAVRPGVLNSGGARAILYSVTNRPGNWPAIAKIFAEALAGDPTSLYNALVRPLHLYEPSHIQTDLSRAAVSCIDSPPYKSEKDWPTPEMMVDETLHVLKTASRHFGASINLIEPDGGCQFWPASGKAPERFTGPWNATLKTPMLIVSNTADPITPLTSGRELNNLMGPSSRLLIQNSPGHCSLGSVSHCTSGWYKDYFLNGKLPPDEFMCEVDAGYFPGGDGVQVEEVLSGEKAELRERSRDMAAAWNAWLAQDDA